MALLLKLRQQAMRWRLREIMNMGRSNSLKFSEMMGLPTQSAKSYGCHSKGGRESDVHRWGHYSFLKGSRKQLVMDWNKALLGAA